MTGNFHTVIVCDKADGLRAQEILASVQRRAVQLEGTVTGEHGIGLGLRDMLVHEVGENAVDMMRRVCFDASSLWPNMLTDASLDQASIGSFVHPQLRQGNTYRGESLIM